MLPDHLAGHLWWRWWWWWWGRCMSRAAATGDEYPRRNHVTQAVAGVQGGGGERASEGTEEVGKQGARSTASRQQLVLTDTVNRRAGREAVHLEDAVAMHSLVNLRGRAPCRRMCRRVVPCANTRAGVPVRKVAGRRTGPRLGRMARRAQAAAAAKAVRERAAGPTAYGEDGL